MVQLWLGSAVMGACVVQRSVLLCAVVGRAMEGLYIQRGGGGLYRVSYKLLVNC